MPVDAPTPTDEAPPQAEPATTASDTSQQDVQPQPDEVYAAAAAVAAAADAGAEPSEAAAAPQTPQTPAVDEETAAAPEEGTRVSDGVAAAAAALSATERPARREIAPGVREILREEAERETRLRRGEPTSVETQSEMPLEQGNDVEAARARRRAELDGAEDAFGPDAGGGETRRDLLPDIDEINSTLRATGDRSGAEADASDIDTIVTSSRRRRGVSIGFVLVLFLVALGSWIYANPTAITNALPMAEPIVAQFLALADGARFWLDDLAQSLVDAS